MIRWRHIPQWLVRAWPAFAIALVVAFHYIGLRSFFEYRAEINKWIGPALQIAGGLIVLFSINENLGLFRKKSIVSATKDWLVEFPRDRPAQTVSVGGSASFNTAAGGSLTVSMRPVPQSVEDRISNIEEELKGLRKSLEARTAEVRASIESTRSGLRSDITVVSTHLQELRSKVEESTVGGFKLQIFGVLLAIYGAFVSIGAQ